MLVALPAGQAFAGDPVIHPLMAGQHTEIGTVTVSDDGTNLTVVFEIDDTLGGDRRLFTTQVLASDKLSKKQKRGAPGQFEYQHLLAGTKLTATPSPWRILSPSTLMSRIWMTSSAIHTEIFVNHDVTHISHLPPRKFRVRFNKVFRQV